MKRHILALVTFVLLTILMLACNGNKQIQNESKSDGERLFVSSCQTCHFLPNPTSQDDKKWPEIVKRYGLRAKLNDIQIASITSYLINNN